MADTIENRSIERRSVFVSHAHADNKLCDRYVGALVSRGIEVWYDRNDLQAGDQLSAEIEQQLQRRKAFIVMLSPASIASYWVRLETSSYRDLMAEDPERILIPMRIAPCEVPPLLRSLLWIDAINKPIDRVIDEIITALDAPARTGGLADEMLSRRGVSRRTMLFALAGTATVGALAGGALTLLAGADGLIPGAVSTRIVYAPTNTPAPTPTPGVGDALFTFTGHAARVTSVAWSPDGARIASASDDGMVKIWSPTSRSNALVFRGHTGSVNSVTWSPDGSQIATAGSDHTVRIWNASTGTTLRTFTGHTKRVNCVDWSHDGKYILSTGDDQTYRIWSPASLQAIRTVYLGTMISTVCRSGAWSPDTRYVIVAEYDGPAVFPTGVVGVFDWESGAPLMGQQGTGSGFKAVTWSHDGGLVAAGGDTQAVDVWNPKAASQGPTILTSTYSGHAGLVNSVQWSADNKRVASGASDQTVQVWNPLTAQMEFTSHQHTAAVNSICWSPDGAYIASGSDDRTVKIIRAK